MTGDQLFDYIRSDLIHYFKSSPRMKMHISGMQMLLEKKYWDKYKTQTTLKMEVTIKQVVAKLVKEGLLHREVKDKCSHYVKTKKMNNFS